MLLVDIICKEGRDIVRGGGGIDGADNSVDCTGMRSVRGYLPCKISDTFFCCSEEVRL